MMDELLKDFKVVRRGVDIARVNYKTLPIHFLLITLAILLIASLSALIPLILKEIVDNADGRQTFNPTLSYLIALAVIYGVVWTANEASEWLKGAFTSYFLASIESALYVYFIKKLFKMKYQHQALIDKGSFVSEVDRAGMAVGQVINTIFWSILPIVVQFVIAFWVITQSVNIGLSLFISVALVFSFYIALKLANQSQKIHPLIYSARNMMTSHAINKLTFLFEIKTNKSYRHELNIANSVGKQFVAKMFKANLLSAKLMLIQILFIGLLLIISNLYLMIRISQSELTAGDFVMISGYVIQLSAPILMLSQLLIRVKGDVIAINDVYKYLDLPEDKTLNSMPKTILTETIYSAVNLNIGSVGNIDKQISFEIKKGFWYSIIGESGSGKSTLIKLLLNLADTQYDKFDFGGINMGDINCDAVLAHVAVVNQNPLLFDGTLSENLIYASEDSSNIDTITTLLTTLNLKHFIPYLNSDSTKWVSQASGGERQRLSIIRAYLRKKSIIVMDEPTSALDEDNVQTVLRFIKNNFDTVIMVTHNKDALAFSNYIMDLSHQHPQFICQNHQ